ncbi:probable tubulin polyglutamylase ttll-15 [Neocloeon triangulifer]|uniref:probable tubulin polyglutamylase ttll-15 n=1 Tax=Neocloeon triangulifer TaxID=2078957 RepID=UPI00286FA9B7|nr:probable tubulin polyglutamylase ttll-15 [Neocloeon triangulifer]
MQHVVAIFQRLGYQVTTNESVEWDVLWAHHYPFDALVKKLKPNQRVSKFPGSGFVTQKVELATSGGLGIPPAFRLPNDKQMFLKYAEANPEAQFVLKNNYHGSIRLKSIGEIDLDSKGSFLQRFISNPFLIDGRKFEIGVSVVVTSIDPLRIYKIVGDVTFRFCKDLYEGLNASNPNQYVIRDEFIPAFDAPALKKYLDLNFSLQDSFEAHLRNLGVDPKLIWAQIDEQIVSAYLNRESVLATLLSRYGHKRSFFEFVRFEFMLDSELKVHLMEAIMSPSLFSAKYPQKSIRYQQVFFTILSLVGLASYVHPPHQNSTEAKDMIVAERNLMVFREICVLCKNCEKFECRLCAPCLAKNEELMYDLKMAYKEHMNKFRSVRIFPPRMTRNQAKLGIQSSFLNHRLTTKNMLLARWFQGKCLKDDSWC